MEIEDFIKAEKINEKIKSLQQSKKHFIVTGEINITDQSMKNKIANLINEEINKEIEKMKKL